MSSHVDFIRTISNEQLNSEEDVRAKIVAPFLRELGYPSEFTQMEVPVYYNEGRGKPKPKQADVVCYNRRTGKPDRNTAFSREYRDSTLLVVEVKKPTEPLDDARAQAEFYAHWTRAPFYCVTNGKSFAFYRLIANAADKEIAVRTPEELSSKWPEVYESFSYEESSKIKSDAVSRREQRQSSFSRYCDHVIAQESINYFDRLLRQTHPPATLSLQDVMVKELSLVIYGAPGMGKSELMRSLSVEIAHQYVDGKSSRIPVLVNARGWHRQFRTLAQGAVLAMEGYVTGVDDGLITNHPEDFCLMIDGLDEAQRDRDLLFDEVISYSKRDGSQVICSSRFTNDANRCGIESAELQGLSDGQIESYLKSNGVDRPHTVLQRFNADGLMLLRNPMHLSCVTKYLMSTRGATIPTNLASVYDYCISNMIGSNVTSGGNADALYLRRTLGSYALEKLTNPDADSFKSFIARSTSFDEAATIERQAITSGLVVATTHGIEFAHVVLQEYLASDYLASRKPTEIEAFCETNGSDERLASLFQMLCGCIRSTEKQSVVFDYLEDNNLPLYISCLHGRLNLSKQMEASLNRKNILRLLAQALKSYVNITDRYLSQTKPYVPFWSSLSSVSAPLCMEADYNPATSVTHIVLKEKSNEEEIITLRVSDEAQGLTRIATTGQRIPVLSLRVSNRPEVHTYNLHDLYGGIDCAREVAIAMVRDDLHDFFSIRTILDEPLGMQVGFAEAALRRSGIKCSDSSGVRQQPTLKRCRTDDVARALCGKPEYLINVDGTDFPASALPYLLHTIEDSGKDYLKLLLPEPDNLKQGGHFVWDHYTEKTIQQWCSMVLMECEQSYRQYVKSFFGALGPWLPTYSEGPLSLKIVTRKRSGDSFMSDWEFRVSQYPIPEHTDATVEITTDDSPDQFNSKDFLLHANEFARKARLLGRPGIHYHEWTIGSGSMLADQQFIRKTVLRRVKQELQELFRIH